MYLHIILFVFLLCVFVLSLDQTQTVPEQQNVHVNSVRYHLHPGERNSVLVPSVKYEGGIKSQQQIQKARLQQQQQNDDDYPDSDYEPIQLQQQIISKLHQNSNNFNNTSHYKKHKNIDYQCNNGVCSILEYSSPNCSYADQTTSNKKSSQIIPTHDRSNSTSSKETDNNEDAVMLNYDKKNKIKSNTSSQKILSAYDSFSSLSNKETNSKNNTELLKEANNKHYEEFFKNDNYNNNNNSNSNIKTEVTSNKSLQIFPVYEQFTFISNRGTDNIPNETFLNHDNNNNNIKPEVESSQILPGYNHVNFIAKKKLSNDNSSILNYDNISSTNENNNNEFYDIPQSATYKSSNIATTTTNNNTRYNQEENLQPISSYSLLREKENIDGKDELKKNADLKRFLLNLVNVNKNKKYNGYFNSKLINECKNMPALSAIPESEDTLKNYSHSSYYMSSEKKSKKDNYHDINYQLFILPVMVPENLLKNFVLFKERASSVNDNNIDLGIIHDNRTISNSNYNFNGNDLNTSFNTIRPFDIQNTLNNFDYNKSHLNLPHNDSIEITRAATQALLPYNNKDVGRPHSDILDLMQTNSNEQSITIKSTSHQDSFMLHFTVPPFYNSVNVVDQARGGSMTQCVDTTVLHLLPDHIKGMNHTALLKIYNEIDRTRSTSPSEIHLIPNSIHLDSQTASISNEITTYTPLVKYLSTIINGSSFYYAILETEIGNTSNNINHFTNVPTDEEHKKKVRVNEHSVIVSKNKHLQQSNQDTEKIMNKNKGLTLSYINAPLFPTFLQFPSLTTFMHRSDMNIQRLSNSKLGHQNAIINQSSGPEQKPNTNSPWNQKTFSIDNTNLIQIIHTDTKPYTEEPSSLLTNNYQSITAAPQQSTSTKDFVTSTKDVPEEHHLTTNTTVFNSGTDISHNYSNSTLNYSYNNNNNNNVNTGNNSSNNNNGTGGIFNTNNYYLEKEVKASNNNSISTNYPSNTIASLMVTNNTGNKLNHLPNDISDKKIMNMIKQFLLLLAEKGTNNNAQKNINTRNELNTDQHQHRLYLKNHILSERIERRAVKNNVDHLHDNNPLYINDVNILPNNKEISKSDIIPITKLIKQINSLISKLSSTDNDHYNDDNKYLEEKNKMLYKNKQLAEKSYKISVNPIIKTINNVMSELTLPYNKYSNNNNINNETGNGNSGNNSIIFSNDLSDDIIKRMMNDLGIVPLQRKKSKNINDNKYDAIGNITFDKTNYNLINDSNINYDHNSSNSLDYNTTNYNDDNSINFDNKTINYHNGDSFEQNNVNHDYNNDNKDNFVHNTNNYDHDKGISFNHNITNYYHNNGNSFDQNNVNYNYNNDNYTNFDENTINYNPDKGNSFDQNSINYDLNSGNSFDNNTVNNDFNCDNNISFDINSINSDKNINSNNSFDHNNDSNVNFGHKTINHDDKNSNNISSDYNITNYDHNSNNINFDHTTMIYSYNNDNNSLNSNTIYHNDNISKKNFNCYYKKEKNNNYDNKNVLNFDVHIDAKFPVGEFSINNNYNDNNENYNELNKVNKIVNTINKLPDNNNHENNGNSLNNYDKMNFISNQLSDNDIKCINNNNNNNNNTNDQWNKRFLNDENAYKPSSSNVIVYQLDPVEEEEEEIKEKDNEKEEMVNNKNEDNLKLLIYEKNKDISNITSNYNNKVICNEPPGQLDPFNSPITFESNGYKFIKKNADSILSNIINSKKNNEAKITVTGPEKLVPKTVDVVNPHLLRALQEQYGPRTIHFILKNDIQKSLRNPSETKKMNRDASSMQSSDKMLIASTTSVLPQSSNDGSILSRLQALNESLMKLREEINRSMISNRNDI